MRRRCDKRNLFFFTVRDSPLIKAIATFVGKATAGLMSLLETPRSWSIAHLGVSGVPLSHEAERGEAVHEAAGLLADVLLDVHARRRVP